MKKIIIAGLFTLLIFHVSAQNLPYIERRQYWTDTIRVDKPRAWKAAAEVVGINLTVWGFNHFIMDEEFAKIGLKTWKRNLSTSPQWDTDKFSTNLVAHPYHGSLYFNSARSNGMSFWQSVPFTLGGSLIWEFFMENELPSLNDLYATTFGGVELGEITYRLSDLFIDNRTSGRERIVREILTGIISPVRGLNRVISGEAWAKSTNKGRKLPSVPLSFTVNTGVRFLAEEEQREDGVWSPHLDFLLYYGTPFGDDYYSPYEWFQLSASFDFFTSQPLINQVNAIGVLWGKKIWEKRNRELSFGIFQHFDYYDSEITLKDKTLIVPYRISQAAAVGIGFLYHRKGGVMDVFSEQYVNAMPLGASFTDYFFVDERDYNLGSGFSIKSFTGLTYKKHWNLSLNFENYHIFTWKGYDPEMDLSTVDFFDLDVQGDEGNARLTVFTSKFSYYAPKKWNISFTNRNFTRRSHYKFHPDVSSSSSDVMLTLGYTL